jgi:hypothetical protein
MAAARTMSVRPTTKGMNPSAPKSPKLCGRPIPSLIVSSIINATTGSFGSVSAGWRRQRLIILADFRVEYAQAAAASRRGLVQAFAHGRVPTSVRRVRSAASKAQLLTPSNCNSRLHPKERRNSQVAVPTSVKPVGFLCLHLWVRRRDTCVGRAANTTPARGIRPPATCGF